MGEPGCKQCKAYVAKYNADRRRRNPEKAIYHANKAQESARLRMEQDVKAFNDLVEKVSRLEAKVSRQAHIINEYKKLIEEIQDLANKIPSNVPQIVVYSQLPN